MTQIEMYLTEPKYNAFSCDVCKEIVFDSSNPKTYDEAIANYEKFTNQHRHTEA